MRRMLSIVRAADLPAPEPDRPRRMLSASAAARHHAVTSPCVGVPRWLRSDSGSSLRNVEGVTSATRLHNVFAAEPRAPLRRSPAPAACSAAYQKRHHGLRGSDAVGLLGAPLGGG